MFDYFFICLFVCLFAYNFGGKKLRRKYFGGKNFGELLGISAAIFRISAEKKSASIFAETFSVGNF